MARQKSWRHRLKQFVTSFKGAVLTAGALAGAVGAVIALLPKHEPHPSTLKASFSDVSVYPNVDLDEYEARFASHAVAQTDGRGAQRPPLLTVPYRLVDAAHASAPAKQTAASDPSTPALPGRPATRTETTHPATSTETTTTTDSTTTTETSETTEEPITTTTETTTEETSSPVEPIPPAPFKETDGVLARDGNGTDPKEEQAIVEGMLEIELHPKELAAPTHESATVAVPDACNSPPCGAMTPMLDRVHTYDPDPVKAARAVALAFAHSRGRVLNGKLYPSGVAVNYTIDLTGWSKREAILEWSLWSRGGKRPLPRPWLRDVIAREVKAKAEDETVAGHFWIPAPPERGDYVVHLTVYDDEHIEHGEDETKPPFH